MEKKRGKRDGALSSYAFRGPLVKTLAGSTNLLKWGGKKGYKGGKRKRNNEIPISSGSLPLSERTSARRQEIIRDKIVGYGGRLVEASKTWRSREPPYLYLKGSSSCYRDVLSVCGKRMKTVNRSERSISKGNKTLKK